MWTYQKSVIRDNYILLKISVYSVPVFYDMFGYSEHENISKEIKPEIKSKLLIHKSYFPLRIPSCAADVKSMKM